MNQLQTDFIESFIKKFCIPRLGGVTIEPERIYTPEELSLRQDMVNWMKVEVPRLCKKYALSKIPVHSDISKLKTMPGKSFPKESYLEEDGWNSARDEMEYQINEDYKSLNN